MHRWLIDNAHVILWAVGCFSGFLAAVGVLRYRAALEWRTVVALVWALFGLMLGGIWQARLEWMPLGEALSISPSDVVGGGGRITLGLAIGAVLAAAWCLVSRSPWRATGDALAVAATVIEIAGRFGCLAAGCCTGIVCGRRALLSLCLQHGPRSEVFARQFAQGLIDASAGAALPTHPLPIYFMVSAAVLLTLLLWQLRRGLAPGTLLVTFGFLWPLSKLALEQLREAPRPPGLATAVPVAMLVASAVIMAFGLRRPRSRAPYAVTAAGRPDPG